MPLDDDFEDDRDEGGYGRRTGAWPHSGLGVASFITGILALLMIVGVVVLVAVAVARAPNGREPARELFFFTGLLVVGSGLIALVGTGLGIGALCQSERKKVFGVIGLAINGLLLLGGIGVMLLGVLATLGTHR